MIVFSTLMIFGCFGFFIPKEYLKRYMLISAICISSLYFFFIPPVYYDLSRHYELLHILRKLDLKSVLFGTEELSNQLLNEYKDLSKVYLVYAYVISQFGIDSLLPAITGVIIYSVVSKIIVMTAEDSGQTIEDWKISFCFFFLLMMTDFRTISGIRNMLSYALFSYVLYMDLVKNASKIWCFIAYFLIANIHSSVYVLIVIRLLSSTNIIFSKWINMVVLFLSYSFLDTITQLLSKMTAIPMVQSLLAKILLYGDGGGSQYIYRRAAIRLFQMIVYLSVSLYVKKNMYLQKKYSQYYVFYIYVILFTFGAIRQYDFFVRNNVLLYFMFFPFLLSFLKNAVGSYPHELIASDHATMGIGVVCNYMLICIAVFLSMIFYYLEYYTSMDSCFVFF